MDPPLGPSLGPYDYQLVVIGGGAGGLAAAKEAAGLRMKVLLLDVLTPSPRGTERVLGGSSLNADSIRRFLHQASLLGTSLKDAQKYGWRLQEEGSHSWTDLVQAVKEQLRRSSEELRRELKRSGVFYLEARGRLVGPHTVEATEASGRTRSLRAETVIIATGDKPRYPEFPGAKEFCLACVEDLLSLPRPPGRTLVVGGAPEGLEVAGFLSGLGYPVVVMATARPLPSGFDRKMAAKLEDQLLVSGVHFLSGCSLVKVELADQDSADPAPQLRVTFVSMETQTKQEVFDTVILLVGRDPSTPALGLDSVGVGLDPESGLLEVNEVERSDSDHVYAVGSVQNRPQNHTGLSVHAGKLLARRLCGGGQGALCDYDWVSSLTLTPLEYASCGLSEESASLKFGADGVQVFHSWFWPSEWTLPQRNKNSCYMKVICRDDQEERVLGIHVMGPGAGDVLQGFSTAMKSGLTKPQLDSTPGISPGTAQVLCSLTETQRMTEAMMVRGNC